jgi:hypothetical protein
MWSSPASSTKRAPSTCAAMYRPSSTRESRSPVRWRTSVGTEIAGRIARTSMALFIRISAAAAPGLAAALARAAHQRLNASSAPGRIRWASASKPQSRSIRSAYASRSALVGAHG